jgi:hypothetical protein
MINKQRIEEAAEKYWSDRSVYDEQMPTIREAFTAGANWAVKEYEKEIQQLKQRLDKSTDKLVSYEATIGFLKDALQEIADEDFRGNRSSGSVKAYQALQKIKQKISAENKHQLTDTK